MKKYTESRGENVKLFDEGESIYIFMANGYSWHGGLCDRFKGIVTCYRWCKKNGKEFKILFNHPFNLVDYVVPNMYDWQIDEKDVIYDQTRSDVFYMMYDKSIQSLINNGRIYRLTESYMDRKMCYCPKKQLHFYSNAQPESNKEFGYLYRELFKPSERLQKELDRHQANIHGSYISVSFRFLQLLGDFKDTYGETLMDNEKQVLIDKSVAVVKELHKSNMKCDKILVTSDSSTFLSHVSQLPFVYVVEGSVGHIEFESSDDANLKTFVDFYMIAGAEKVYLALSGKMYKSDFAYRASMINNKDFEIVYY